MSNEFVPDCLVHKDSRNIQTRLDYMLFYRNETKAKVIRIMETWTDTKRAEWYKHYVESKEQGFDVPLDPPEEALWVTMSYEEFSIYAYGTMAHDNIKENVDALVEHEHLKRRPHPQIPYGPPQYLLDTQLLQAILNDQEIPSLFDDIGKIRPPRKKRTPQVKYPQGGGKNTLGDGVKIPPPWGENTPPSNNTTKNYRELPNNKDTYATSSEVALHTSNVRDIEVMRKRKTEPRLPAVHLTIETPSQYHIVNSGYEKDADEEPTVKMPAIPKQKPDAGVPLSSVVTLPVGDQDDAASGQAIPSGSPSGTDAAQRTITGADGAVQASDDQVNGVNKAIPKRPRAKKAVTQAKVPAFVLTEQQQAFWTLWCSIWFNVDIPPMLNETAYSHVKILAPFIVTTELLDSLAEYTRKDLADSQGIKRKRVQLGNLVYCYPGWKQAQQQGTKNISKNGTDLNVYGLQALLERQQKAM